jgi:hypothetical protein
MAAHEALLCAQSTVECWGLSPGVAFLRRAGLAVKTGLTTLHVLVATMGSRLRRMVGRHRRDELWPASARFDCLPRCQSPAGHLLGLTPRGGVKGAGPYGRCAPREGGANGWTNVLINSAVNAGGPTLEGN